MAGKTSFTPDEWTKILESTAVTGMAVTAAEPSGLRGHAEADTRVPPLLNSLTGCGSALACTEG
jgi:hypothetical protein